MRIAFVTSTRRWGGNKTWAIDLGTIAVQQGHDVFVYGRDPRFIERGHDLGMKGCTVHFGPDFNPRCIAWFYRIFKQEGITHVVVNVGKDLRTAGIAAKLLHIPLVVMVGAPTDFTNSWGRKFVHDLLKPAYICSSHFIARNIVDNVPYLNNAYIDYVHPGTVMPEDPPSPSVHPYTLITTSQLTPPKHHDDLIGGCALLREKGIPFNLHIVGTGDQEERLKNMVHALQLEENVQFRGFSNTIAQELRQADIFVLPTKAEPLGIALEEAMAHGLFPLIRNSGGAPEIYPRDFSSWLLAPEAGPEDFATTLERLLTVSPANLDEWRRHIQTHARATFNQEAQFNAFASFLDQIPSSG